MSADEHRGVLEQHQHRSATDPEYRDAAMTAPSITDKTGISAKRLAGTAPTVPAARDENEDTPTGMIVDEPASPSTDSIDDTESDKADDSSKPAKKRGALRGRDKTA